MPRIDFWYEFASTYSYPAAMRIEALARPAGVAVRWRPFLLGPLFFEQGWRDSPFNIYPVKGRYMWRDLERTCEALGLPLQRPQPFPAKLAAGGARRARRSTIPCADASAAPSTPPNSARGGRSPTAR